MPWSNVVWAEVREETPDKKNLRSYGEMILPKDWISVTIVRKRHLPSGEWRDVCLETGRIQTTTSLWNEILGSVVFTAFTGSKPLASHFPERDYKSLRRLTVSSAGQSA